MQLPTIPRSVQALIDAFSRLPGIGPKSASRLTYYLLRADDDVSQSLAQALSELKANTRYCPVCFNITDQPSGQPCAICGSEQRDSQTLCVVEDPLDVIALERARVFRGRYHVLHGVLSPINGIGPDQLRIHELVVRVQGQPIKEVIVATNPTLEGEATAMYLQGLLAPLGVKLTRLARGLPMGGDLEYADETTLARALEARQSL